jgi:S-adenosylmethionine decarboxylase
MDGLHLIADLHACSPRHAGLMTEPKELESFCLAAVSSAGLSPVAKLFHSFRSADSLDPPSADQSLMPITSPLVGITGVVLLAESHCAIHTWPEKDAVTLDVYVCNYGSDNSAKARVLMSQLIEGFGSQKVMRQEIVRGAKVQ